MEKLLQMQRILIQMFAEESETTDYVDGEVTEDENITDSESEVTETSTSTEEGNEENPEIVEEPKKAKTLKELLGENPQAQDEFNNIVKSRVNREKSNFETKISKLEELAYLTQRGLKAEDLDDVLEKSRQFYGKQGIVYTPKANEKDEEILANAYAQQIIDSCNNVDEIEEEANKLVAKGTKISNKEKLILQNLIKEMENEKRISDLKKLGAKKEIYESSEFKKFESQFTKEASISDIYKYFCLSQKSTKKVENPGSMKTTPAPVKKEYITEAEYDRMTDKEIEENMDLIRKSMLKW